MLATVRAIVRDGKIELLEPITLPDGATLLVTVLVEEEMLFWQQASNPTLDTVWNNDEDDIYAQLLS